MRYRKLGRTNWAVSEIGYGAWGIGGTQWRGGSDDEALAALHQAIELGLNFIDTALAYGDGHSEALVGQVVREAGQKIYVATKVPPMNHLWPARRGIGIDQVFPSHYILESTGRSLKNLGLEQIDLQQLHVWNPEWVDSEEWRRAVEDLKRSGKIRAFGVSINDHDPDSALGLDRDRSGRRRAGDLQHLRPVGGAEPVPAVHRAEYRRAGARAAGRRRTRGLRSAWIPSSTPGISARSISAVTARGKWRNASGRSSATSAARPPVFPRPRCVSASPTPRSRP